nr:MAG TPA: YjcQ protein [Caudoviricetes sp.]
MDNFKTIYRILSTLEKSMDIEEPDWRCISAERLGVSEARWKSLMQALIDAGYIAGVKAVSTKTDGLEIYLLEPRITLSGLEYLENNTMMKKAYRLAKGIKDITPGL